MQMTFRPARPAKKGYALTMVMIFLAASLLVLGSVMYWTFSNSEQVDRNNLYFTSQAAAEAATEQVIANINRDYLHQSINSASSYETNIPSQTGWPIQYTFSSSAGANKTYVSVGAMSTTLTNLGSVWAGLQGFPQNVQITSTATPKNQRYAVPATVTETNQYADIPLFQYAIFYNINLEIQPGAAMSIGGQVFCNQSIWAASTGLVFSNSVTAAGTVNSNNISDPFMTSGSKTGSGNPTFMGTVATNHAELNMPVGTNNSASSVEAILQLPPMTLGSAGAYTSTGQVYFANQAELIMTNSSSFTNISVFYQDPSNAPTIQSVPYDKTNAGIGYYSFVSTTNFYDYRESKTVKAIYLNVTNLSVWLTNTATGGGSTFNNKAVNDTGKGINSIYIYDSVPMTSTTLPAVQIANAAQLPPNGLAVATPDPVYTLGNFNSQTPSGSDAGTAGVNYTYPAALFADAITVLSSSWNDTNYISSTTLGSRTLPVETTVNAAALEGIVPSSGTNYSGGVENFLRLLENWTSVPLYYNGSIVVMFPSQYATNRWQNTGVYYNAPVRDWAFDINFKNGGLPPMTPRVKAIIRQGWLP
jgi:hypothetical protein